jgi:WD40 repeat protein
MASTLRKVIQVTAFAHGFATSASLAPAQAAESSASIELVRTAGHTESINALAFSPDGKTIVTRSGDYTVKLWNSATGLMLRTIKGYPCEL